jgi:cbb3-type cytochrome oxidase maturation protein
MSVIFLLIPLSIVTAAVFLGGFIWAVRSGQYEDTCTPAMRPLMDDEARKDSQEQSDRNPQPENER